MYEIEKVICDSVQLVVEYYNFLLAQENFTELVTICEEGLPNPQGCFSKGALRDIYYYFNASNISLIKAHYNVLGYNVLLGQQTSAPDKVEIEGKLLEATTIYNNLKNWFLNGKEDSLIEDYFRQMGVKYFNDTTNTSGNNGIKILIPHSSLLSDINEYLDELSPHPRRLISLPSFVLTREDSAEKASGYYSRDTIFDHKTLAPLEELPIEAAILGYIPSNNS